MSKSKKTRKQKSELKTRKIQVNFSVSLFLDVIEDKSAYDIKCAIEDTIYTLRLRQEGVNIVDIVLCDLLLKETNMLNYVKSKLEKLN